VLALQAHTAGGQLQRQQQIGSLTKLNSLHAASAALAGDAQVRSSMHAARHLLCTWHAGTRRSSQHACASSAIGAAFLQAQPAGAGADPQQGVMIDCKHVISVCLSLNLLMLLCSCCRSTL
jgi:hypothetical protein